MNQSQRRVLCVAGVVLAISFLFPPWEQSFRGSGRVTSNGRLDELFTTTTTFDGYGFIGRSGAGLRIDSGRWFGQCAAIGIVSAIAFACCGIKVKESSDGTGDKRRP